MVSKSNDLHNFTYSNGKCKLNLSEIQIFLKNKVRIDRLLFVNNYRL
jgi:hypothetical protein